MSDVDEKADAILRAPVGRLALWMAFCGLLQNGITLWPEFQKAKQERAVQQEQAQALRAELDAGMQAHAKLQEAYQQVASLQDEFALSDRQFEEILRAEWSAKHPEDSVGPWQFRLGTIRDPYWWRSHREWDLEAVRDACERLAVVADPASDAIAMPGEPRLN